MPATSDSLDAVAAAAERLRAAEDAQRKAIGAAHDAGASLRQIAAQAQLSHEQVRRVVRGRAKRAAYFVTVERRGVSPLQTRLLVRATSRQAAGELACCLAERQRGGIFEATHVRRAVGPHAAYDDTGV